MVGSGADVTLQPCLCQSGQMFKGNCRAPHGGGHSCSLHVDAKPSTTQDKCQLQICCSVGDSKPSKTFVHETHGELSGSTVSTEMNHNAGRCFVTSTKLEKLKSTCIRWWSDARCVWETQQIQRKDTSWYTKWQIQLNVFSVTAASTRFLKIFGLQ